MKIFNTLPISLYCPSPNNKDIINTTQLKRVFKIFTTRYSTLYTERIKKKQMFAKTLMYE